MSAGATADGRAAYLVADASGTVTHASGAVERALGTRDLVGSDLRLLAGAEPVERALSGDAVSAAGDPGRPPLRLVPLVGATPGVLAVAGPAGWPLLEQLLAEAPLGFALYDAEGRYVYVNDELARMHGVPAADHIGRRLADVMPRLAPEVEPHIRGASANAEAVEREIELRVPGELGPRVWRATWFAVDGGVAAVVLDLTDSRRAEVRVSVQHEVAAVLAASETLASAAEGLLRAIAVPLGFAVAALWRVDEEAQLLRPVAGWQAPGAGADLFLSLTRKLALGPGDGLLGRVWSRGEPVWLTDMRQSGRFVRARPAAMANLGAGLAMPVSARGRVRAVVELYGPELRTPDADVRELITAVGRQISQFIQRRDAEKAREALLAAEREARHAAELAAGRAHRLQAVSAALASARTVDEVAGAVVEQGVGVLGAERAVLVVREGERLRLAASHGYPDEALAGRESFSVEEAFPIAEAVRRREAVVVDAETAASRYPGSFAAAGMSALTVSVPLLVGERAIGAVGLGLDAPGELRQEDLAVLLALGRQCAQALERVRLDELEQQLHREAEDARARMAFLATASETLAGSLDYGETLAEVARLVVPRLADWCSVEVVEDGELRNLAVAHVDPAKVRWARELQERYPSDPAATTGVPNVVRTGRPELYPQVSDELLVAAAVDEEMLALLRGIGFSSAMIVPLTTRGTTLGAITFVAAESGEHYDQHDLALALDLARRAAGAIENARLHRREQTAREQAERAAERAARLQGVTAALSGARTRAEVARVLLEEGVSALGAAAGWVGVVSGDGRSLVPAATLALAGGAMGTAVPLAADVPVSEAARTGRAVWLESAAALAARYPDVAERYGALGTEAAVAVPLLTARRTLGALFLSFREPRAFVGEDQALVLTVAAQCAQAFERAALYEREHAIAVTLQRDLLPPAVPAIAGMDVATLYRPIGEGVEVGGDFIDVFELPSGGWALTIGDVSGKGIAAAALTGMVRNAIRVAALRAETARDVLGWVNDALVADLATGERFATAVYAELRPRGGGATARVVCAGHLLPMVLRADGAVERAAVPGTVLGQFPEPVLEEATVELAPGESLVLYTDGIVEARRSDGETFGESRLREVLASTRGLSSADLVDRIEAAALAFQPQLQDDIAIVAIQPRR